MGGGNLPTSGTLLGGQGTGGGLVSGTIVSSSGYELVSSGGIGVATVISGGTLEVASGGSASGGAEKKVAHDGPRYSAIYEIDDPHVLVSQEWGNAVEQGRWPTQIRPFTHNRKHALYKVR
jgi:hypothetical protein